MSQFQPVSQWQVDHGPTSGAGSAFASLPSHECDEVTIINPSVAVDFQCYSQDPDANAFATIAANGGITIQVAANSREIMVRRNDVSNTPVQVKFIWRKYRR